MNISVARERPDSPDATALIEELEAHLSSIYPAENRHGLSVARLISENVAFFVLRCDGAPAGCGGIKLYGDDYGELKRMYVRPQFRGQRFGEIILEYLLDYARDQGISTVRLETGTFQEGAIRLYERVGFRSCGPFGEYEATPMNIFYEMAI